MSVSDLGEDEVEVLSDFATSPAGFALGIVLEPLLEGLEDIVIDAINGILLIFVGDEVGTTTGTVGIADIPLLAAQAIIDAGDLIGKPVLSAAGGFVAVVVAGFEAAGPLGMISGAIFVMVLAYIYASYIRFVAEVLLDFIPGGGALIN